MSTTWGSYVTVGAIKIRAGLVLSVSPSTVTPATTSVTVSGSLRLQQQGSGFASGTDEWSVTGGHSASGTKTWSTNSDGQIVVIATFTKTVSLIYGQAQTVTVRGEVSDVGPSSADPWVSGSITVPARPLSVPAAPSGVSVVRVSDVRQDLAWTRNVSTSAPYTNQLVRRRTDGAGEYVTVARLSGTATSYADTSTQAGRVYEYAILAQNSAGGAAGYAVPAAHATTPLTPAAPRATKQTNGDIVVSRPALSYGATWSVRHVETGTVLATSLTGTTWTHTDPSPTQTWTYDVRASSASPVLHSAWSADSGTIQLIAPPLAPSQLAPSVADPADGFYLTWQHSPVDGTPQRAYQVQSRASSADVWDPFTLEVSSAQEQHLVAPGAWSGTSREWRVRTWGQHADPSPYSTTGVLRLSARPVVGITHPEVVHDSQRATVRWTFFDPEGSVQAGWRVTLLQDGQQREVLTHNRFGGHVTQALLATVLADGATYTVQVEALDGAGLWSATAERTFTVSYAPPATPVLHADWRTDDGYVVLSGTVPDPVGSQRPLDHVRVERATPSGWVVVEDDLPPEGAVTDMIPPTGTVVTYRAVAVSDIGSEAYTTVSVETKTRWVFLNHGPGWGQVVRVWGNIQASRTFSRDKTLKRYAGRPFPVERAGTARERTYALSGVLFAPWAPPDLTSTFEDFEAVADAAAPVCVRDPEGVRLFVSTSGVDLADHGRVHRRVSLTLTQVDHVEETL